MKKIMLFLLALWFLSFSTAQAYTFNLQKYDTEVTPSKKAQGADGVQYNTGDWYSSIGDGFENYDMSLTGDNNHFTMSLTTEFGITNSFYGSGSNQAQLGDFFIQTGSDYNFAFDLSNMDSNLDSKNDIDSGLYRIDLNGNEPYKYANDYFEQSYIIGDGYRAETDQGYIDAKNIVRMGEDADLVYDVKFTTFKNSDGNYTYTIAGNFDLMDSLGLEWGQDFDFLWATATCANSGLMGRVATSTPEAHALLMFGTGLLGVAWLGRKRLNKNL